VSPALSQSACPKKRVSEKLPVGQAQHAGTERRQHRTGQRRLTLGIGAQTGAEQHVRAILHQRHKAQLWEGALATAGPGHAKFDPVRRGVGHLQAGAIQADQPPVPVPRPLAGAGSDGAHHFLIEPAQRRFAQTTARLRNAALARHLDRLGTPQPAQPLQQAAQHLARARTHVERQGDGVVDHHLRRQITLALARPASLRQYLAHPFGRHGPGDYPKADEVA
jgi:hypothetical protein